jgi:hypothetical protein
MPTFNELPLGTHFTIGAANPNGTPCVKESYVSKGNANYGDYRFADDSHCNLIQHDCQVTILLYPGQIGLAFDR